jgi:hypothetical protein
MPWLLMGNGGTAPLFLTLDGDEWSASGSCRFTLGETVHGTHCRGGWVARKLWRKEHFLHLLGIEPRLLSRPSRSLLVSRTNAGDNQSTFLRNMLPPSSGSKSKSNKKPARIKQQGEPAVCFMLVSCLAYYSSLKKESICSSGTSADLPNYKALFPRRPNSSLRFLNSTKWDVSRYFYAVRTIFNLPAFTRCEV